MLLQMSLLSVLPGLLQVLNWVCPEQGTMWLTTMSVSKGSVSFWQLSIQAALYMRFYFVFISYRNCLLQVLGPWVV